MKMRPFLAFSLLLLSSSLCAEEVRFSQVVGITDPAQFTHAFPPGSTVELDPGQQLETACAMKIHLQEQVESGASFGRATGVPPDVAHRLRSGKLAFACKAVSDDCSFKLELVGSERDRKTPNSRLETIFTAKSQWQEVAIPLSDFLGEKATQFVFDQDLKMIIENPGSLFNLEQLTIVTFRNVAPQPANFYVAKIRIIVSD